MRVCPKGPGRPRRGPWLALALLVAGLAGACAPEDASPPSRLRVGVLPDQERAALDDRYGPLLVHLAETLDLDVELRVPADYAALVEAFRAGEVDLAYFGGATFVQAHRTAGAVPLVMRDVDAEFTSYFIASQDDEGGEIRAFAGRPFAFGSALSTSGHLMPRYFLHRMGIVSERFFGEVLYSGSHDQTVYWVRDGRAALGAVNAEIFAAMIRDGRLAPGAVRIVWETPLYADYVWAVRPAFGEAFRLRLRDAFLELAPGHEGHRDILRRMGSDGFLPASIGDFADLSAIMARVERLQSAAN